MRYFGENLTGNSELDKGTRLPQFYLGIIETNVVNIALIKLRAFTKCAL
jgi:hypothetical protein